MRPIRLLLLSLTALLVFGCATTPARVDLAVPPPPEASEGDIAVFGRLRLVEFINKIPMPTENQSGSIYLKPAAPGKTYKLSCSNTGDFGVYLPVGDYTVTRIKVWGYVVDPEEMTLSVPSGHKAVYAGTIVLDGTPAGVSPGSGDTRFVLTLKDEYPGFAAAVKKASPGSEAQVVKSLFAAGNSLGDGSYPNKVHRAEDIANDLRARSDAVEEAFTGGVYVLPYILNPVWILTLP